MTFTQLLPWENNEFVKFPLKTLVATLQIFEILRNVWIKQFFRINFYFLSTTLLPHGQLWETLLKRASLTRCKSLRSKSLLRPKRNWEPCNKNGSLTWPSAYLGLNRDFSNSITAPWPTRPLSPISRQPLLKF